MTDRYTQDIEKEWQELKKAWKELLSVISFKRWNETELEKIHKMLRKP